MAPSIAELPESSSTAKQQKLDKQTSFDLFPQSRKAFSDALFVNPTSEYRGSPLWSWNTKLDNDQLMRQIDDLEEMGLGGFFMHPRVGLDTEYLGEEFMQLIKNCVERAKEKKMHAWLYDEDRWPSGAAGGMVTKDEDSFRSRHMLITPWKYGDPERPHQAEYARLLNWHLLSINNISLVKTMHAQLWHHEVNLASSLLDTVSSWIKTASLSKADD